MGRSRKSSKYRRHYPFSLKRLRKFQIADSELGLLTEKIVKLQKEWTGLDEIVKNMKMEISRKWTDNETLKKKFRRLKKIVVLDREDVNTAKTLISSLRMFGRRVFLHADANVSDLAEVSEGMKNFEKKPMEKGKKSAKEHDLLRQVRASQEELDNLLAERIELKIKRDKLKRSLCDMESTEKKMRAERDGLAGQLLAFSKVVVMTIKDLKAITNLIGSSGGNRGVVVVHADVKGAELQSLKKEAKDMGLELDSDSDSEEYGQKPMIPNMTPSSIPVSYGFRTSKKIDIPNGRVGVIIGKRGETIKYLELQSGAQIHVTRDTDADPNSLTRMVKLKGTQEQIDKAEQFIKDVIAKAEAGGFGIVSRRVTGHQAGSEQFVMSVPNKKVDLVIGRGSETIKHMQASSGARIQVIPLHLAPGDTSTHRKVQIDGTSEQVETAKQLINEVISQADRRCKS